MFEKSLITEAEQIENILLKADYIEWEKLKNKTILVTGGTGLVGSTFIKLLLIADRKFSLGINVLALVRKREKGEALFGNKTTYLVGDLEHLPEINGEIHYIMHGASPTVSRFFAEKPVETVKTAVLGTINMLDLAVKSEVESFVYLSSMEVYGERMSDEPVTEVEPLCTMPLRTRSCYPQAKILCENLVVDYFAQYGLNGKSVRLAQTFGPGIPADDNRVFAQFARAAIGGTDIELLTPGTTKQCYLYTLDAALAILTVMLKGEGGNSYNAANPDTYCSIKEMAELVANELSCGKTKVIINLDKDAALKYPPAHKWNLSADKLCALGWKPTCNLKDMYALLIAYLKETNA